MFLSGHYMQDEEEIRSALSGLVGHYRLDRALGWAYRSIDGGHDRDSAGKNREPLILMDTSALMETPSSDEFIRKISPALSRRGQKLVVPISVLGELKNIAMDNPGRKQGINAGKMLGLVLDFWRRGTVAVYDNHGAGGIFADEMFQVLAVGFARHFRVIVVSQDYFLGQDLLTICRLPSVKGRDISVRKLLTGGALEKVEWHGADYLLHGRKFHRH